MMTNTLLYAPQARPDVIGRALKVVSPAWHASLARLKTDGPKEEFNC